MKQKTVSPFFFLFFEVHLSVLIVCMHRIASENKLTDGFKIRVKEVEEEPL